MRVSSHRQRLSRYLPAVRNTAPPGSLMEAAAAAALTAAAGTVLKSTANTAVTLRHVPGHGLQVKIAPTCFAGWSPEPTPESAVRNLKLEASKEVSDANQEFQSINTVLFQCFPVF